MRSRGLTLIELMVAMSIFLVLGGALVMFLRVGIDTWRVGETRREAYERSQAIFDQIASDLRSTFSDPSHGAGDVVDVVFLSDYDPHGRQRLRFVRTLAGETRHPITRNAGSLTGGRADLDYIDDAMEAKWGILRAPGGLQEVAYLFGPDPTEELLWRGVKSPIGEERTLFDNSNLYATEEEIAAGARPLKRCRPFVAGVLYMEYNFWGQGTRQWGREENGSSSWWDSTRAIFGDKADASSRHEDRDDIFPGRVQVVLVLRPARATRFARLTRAIGPADAEIFVDSTDHYPRDAYPYIRIEEEWIRYEVKNNRSFTQVERGVRGTIPVEHPSGTPVIYGTTFSRVVRIPGVRHSNWSER